MSPNCCAIAMVAPTITQAQPGTLARLSGLRSGTEAVRKASPCGGEDGGSTILDPYECLRRGMPVTLRLGSYRGGCSRSRPHRASPSGWPYVVRMDTLPVTGLSRRSESITVGPGCPYHGPLKCMLRRSQV
jgi:hypothetical protein